MVLRTRTTESSHPFAATALGLEAYVSPVLQTIGGIRLTRLPSQNDVRHYDNYASGCVKAKVHMTQEEAARMQ